MNNQELLVDSCSYGLLRDSGHRMKLDIQINRYYRTLKYEEIINVCTLEKGKQSYI